jgi:phage/plasmid-like protein (TIGR03299 family)
MIMSHLIDETTGRAAIAYRGETPWHGLGFQMKGNETIDQWRERAGLSWTAESAPVEYRPVGKSMARKIVDDKVVLYRSDTLAPLGIVGAGYKIVQPEDVIEFYRELAASHGFEMETAGALRGGKVIWALAKTGEGAQIVKGDRVEGYVLMSTSFDATMSTTIRNTTVRVVCNNTLQMATGKGTAKPAVNVSHRSMFNAEAARIKLGFDGQFSAFAGEAQAMAKRVVTPKETVAFFLKAYHDMQADQIVEAQLQKTTDKTIARLAEHFMHAPGAELAGQTAWGLLNAVTFDLDHVLGRSQDTRLASSWYGKGAGIKAKAYDLALNLL